MADPRTCSGLPSGSSSGCSGNHGTFRGFPRARFLLVVITFSAAGPSSSLPTLPLGELVVQYLLRFHQTIEGVRLAVCSTQATTDASSRPSRSRCANSSSRAESTFQRFRPMRQCSRNACLTFSRTEHFSAWPDPSSRRWDLLRASGVVFARTGKYLLLLCRSTRCFIGEKLRIVCQHPMQNDRQLAHARVTGSDDKISPPQSGPFAHSGMTAAVLRPNFIRCR